MWCGDKLVAYSQSCQIVGMAFIFDLSSYVLLIHNPIFPSYSFNANMPVFKFWWTNRLDGPTLPQSQYRFPIRTEVRCSQAPQEHGAETPYRVRWHRPAYWDTLGSDIYSFGWYSKSLLGWWPISLFVTRFGYGDNATAAGIGFDRDCHGNCGPSTRF